MKQKLLSWAKQLVSWTMEHSNFLGWIKIQPILIWWQAVCSSPKERIISSRCISHTVKFPAAQMVWGSIWSKGVGHLKFITRTVNASIYIIISDECLKKVIRDHFKGVRHCIFQHDSAPYDTVKSVSGISFFPVRFFTSFAGFHTHNKTDI